MRKYLKYLLMVFVLLPITVHGEIIEITDDDRHQFLHFANCDPAIDSLLVAVQIDPDSGYWVMPHALNDTTDSETFGYIAPDRDANDNLIPGDYSGEYWIYTVSYVNDEPILSEDTSHVSVAYTISGGCSPEIKVD